MEEQVIKIVTAAKQALGYGVIKLIDENTIQMSSMKKEGSVLEDDSIVVTINLKNPAPGWYTRVL